jgi:4'-phosphopantetheinyl transferase
MNKGITKTLSATPESFSLRRIPLDRLVPPSLGEVHLWFLDLGELSGSLSAALGGRSDNPSPATPGQLLMARRFYLRLLLGAYLGLPGKAVKINRKNRGKPILDATVHEEEIHFSMAKSEDKLLIGISASSHIGVDLERAGRQARNAMGVARRYFSADEAAALAALDESLRDEAFLRAWACKESVVKASGMGIANQFHRFSVETDINRQAAVLDFDGKGPGDWSLALVQPSDTFLGALAIEDRLTSLKTFKLVAAGNQPG